MGTWSTSILGDDSAMDIYGYYMELFKKNKKTAEIRKKVNEKFSVYSPQGKPYILDNTSFWLGLAQAQWECNTLESEVLEIVKKIAEEEIDLQNWRDSGEETFNERKKNVLEFYRKIRDTKAPAPEKKKRIAKPKQKWIEYKVGDIVVSEKCKVKFDKAFAALAKAKMNQCKKNIPTDEEIKAAEKALGMEFPPSYIYFLKEGAKFSMPFDEVLGINDDSENGIQSLVRITEEERKNGMPKEFIPIFADGYGNFVCFHTWYRNKYDEYLIVSNDHENPRPGVYQRLAADFSIWYQREVQEQIKQKKREN